MTTLNNLVFLDFSPSAHSRRFIKTARELGYFATFQSYDQAHFDDNSILLLATIDRIPENVMRKKNLKIGVSWAYDLYREPKNPDVAKKRISNLKRIHRLIVDCEWVSDLAKSYEVAESQILIMPYGVNLKNYKFRSAKKLKPNKKLMLYCNRSWENGYGVQEIIDAAQLALENGLDLKLVLSNDGSQRKAILRKYENMEINKKIVYVGKVTEKQNLQFLRKADFFVSASEADGISVSILESMAAGTPVIVSNLEPNKKLIINQKTGILFDRENPDKLKEAFFYAANLSQKPKELIRIIKGARDQIEKQADFTLNLNRVLENIKNSHCNFLV